MATATTKTIRLNEFHQFFMGAMQLIFIQFLCPELLLLPG